MKILQVNITGKSGSTGKIVNDLRTYLQSKGHDAKVAYSEIGRASCRERV